MRAGLLGIVAILLVGVVLHRTPGRAAVEGSEAILRVAATDASGSPIVARVRIAPQNLAERLRLGWTFDVLRGVPRGGAELHVPAGRYKLFVSRGPEWSIVEREVELRPRARAEHRVRLERQVQLTGYLGADLHLHTEHSIDADEHGGISAQDLAAEGVALAAVTDHNVISTLGSDVDSVAGAEITTWAPEVGHFNAFPLRQLPRYKGTTPDRLFGELRQDPDVFVQVNHPRLEDHISYFSLGGFDGKGFATPEFSLDVDGIEIFNGYHIARLDQVRRLLGEYRRWLAQGHHLTATGGSDSHGARRQLPGYPRTYAATKSARDLAGALKRGDAFVTNGPLVSLRVEGQPPGARVQPDERGYVRVDLQVLAAAWLEVHQVSLWADDRQIWSHRLPRRESRARKPLSYEKQARVFVGHAKSLLAVVDGGRGLEVLLGRTDVSPFAFTNPVYLGTAQASPVSPE